MGCLVRNILDLTQSLSRGLADGSLCVVTCWHVTHHGGNIIRAPYAQLPTPTAGLEQTKESDSMILVASESEHPVIL